MLAPKSIFSLIPTLISPGFRAPTVLQVVFPLAFVLGAVDVLVDAGAVGFVVGPEAIIDVAIYVDEFSFAVCAIIAPLARILRAVRPDLLSEAIAEAALPLTFVGGARLELVELAALAGLVGVPVAVATDGLAGLFGREVFATSKLVCPEHPGDSSGLITAPESLNFCYQMHLLLEDVRIIAATGLSWQIVCLATSHLRRRLLLNHCLVVCYLLYKVSVWYRYLPHASQILRFLCPYRCNSSHFDRLPFKSYIY